MRWNEGWQRDFHKIKAPAPRERWSPNLLPIDDPVESLSAPAGRGQKFIPKVALICATACRVVTSIYICG